tara:strand:+ start:1197 stop:1412 length:216 start_codon:yes stop_codon:yes gene_type:complete
MADPNAAAGVNITTDSAMVTTLTEIKGHCEANPNLSTLLAQFRSNPDNRHVEYYLRTIGAIEKIQQIIDAS